MWLIDIMLRSQSFKLLNENISSKAQIHRNLDFDRETFIDNLVDNILSQNIFKFLQKVVSAWKNLDNRDQFLHKLNFG